jgi:hypothetical protein
LFIDDLGLSGDWLHDDNFLMGGGNLDISTDLSDVSDSWLVDEQSAVDFVQKELVVDGVDSRVDVDTTERVTSEDWGITVKDGGGG